MSTFGIFGLIIAGVAAFGGLLVTWIKKGAHDAGVTEERNAETNRSDAAKARADEVLNEQRTPDDAVDRLRRHDF